MTELLYFENSYLREFEATVVAVEEAAVILDRTAFYPGGGGQPCDTGVLRTANREWQVTKVQKAGDRIRHFVEGDPPADGTVVRAHVDWDRRYQLMRTHTAMHVLCGTIFREYGATVTGGQMYPDRARMDFELEDFSPERVAEIERKVNEHLANGLAVSARVLPRDEAFQIPDLIRTKINLLPAEIAEVRVVEIAGLDLQADGGTHVANTKEVGGIRITKTENKGKINKRIELVIHDG